MVDRQESTPMLFWCEPCQDAFEADVEADVEVDGEDGGEDGGDARASCSDCGGQCQTFKREYEFALSRAKADRAAVSVFQQLLGPFWPGSWLRKSADRDDSPQPPILEYAWRTNYRRPCVMMLPSREMAEQLQSYLANRTVVANIAEHDEGFGLHVDFEDEEIAHRMIDVAIGPGTVTISKDEVLEEDARVDDVPPFQFQHEGKIDASEISVVCEECGKESMFAARLIGTTQDCPHCMAYVDVGDVVWGQDFGTPED